jgi:hypothetical protein
MSVIALAPVAPCIREVRQQLIEHGETPSRVGQPEPAPDPGSRACDCVPCAVAWDEFDRLLAEHIATHPW